MCVLLEDFDTKVIKLPPFPVTATRINALQLSVERVEYKAEWSAVQGQFNITSTGGSVHLLECPPSTSKPGGQSSVRWIVSMREISKVIVNNQVKVDMEFTMNTGEVERESYILADGLFWYHVPGGGWWSMAPDFNGDWVQGGTPSAIYSAPPSSDGGGNQNQN